MRERDARQGAARTWVWRPGKPLLGHPIDVVFIGSCTNSRISDLRAAAGVLQGPQSAPKRARDGGAGLAGGQAPGRGRRARPRSSATPAPSGARPGCSMCIAMNGDQLAARAVQRVSTSNRNFEGRQGKGGRTFLASPLTAAASAVTGVVTDVEDADRNEHQFTRSLRQHAWSPLPSTTSIPTRSSRRGS